MSTNSCHIPINFDLTVKSVYTKSPSFEIKASTKAPRMTFILLYQFSVYFDTLSMRESLEFTFLDPLSVFLNSRLVPLSAFLNS